MLLQKGMDLRRIRQNGEAGNQMNADKQRSWREICEELLKEKQTEKVDALLEELAQALDRRALERNPGPDSSLPSS